MTNLNPPYKTHCMYLDTSSGVFQSLDDALRFLEALRNKILRLCNKKHCNCLFYGVVSISEKDTVQRTRYGSKPHPNAKQVPPHIHSMLLTEKQSALAGEIAEYLDKTKAIKKYVARNQKECGYQIDIIKTPADLSRQLLYRVSQGFVFRTADTCNKKFAQKYLGDFVNLIEKQEKTMGGSNLVFPQYSNLELGADESVFDFTYIRKAKTYNSQDAEVFTNSRTQEPSDSSVESYEKTLNLDENNAFEGEFIHESDNFSTYNYCPDCAKAAHKKCNEIIIFNNTYASNLDDRYVNQDTPNSS